MTPLWESPADALVLGGGSDDLFFWGECHRFRIGGRSVALTGETLSPNRTNSHHVIAYELFIDPSYLLEINS